MGDFIKDLNIIDFLGMLLPGSLFIISTQKALPVDELLKYFGEDPGVAPRITFLLVAGYVIGMLFHELGDFLEWLLHKCSCFDPRTRAAKRTGLIDHLVAGGKSKTKSDALQAVRKGDSIYFSVIDNKTDTRKRNLFEGFRTMARNLFLVLLLLLFFPGGFPKGFPGVLAEANTVQIFFYVGACTLLFMRYRHYSYLKFKYSYEDYLSTNKRSCL